LNSVRRLPALERCLARADCEVLGEGGWRGWLFDRLGVPLRSGTAPAYWLATPVHYVAGLDTLRLHGDGLLHLPLSEQQRLAAEFARVFAGSGWELLATDARELLLRGPMLSAESPDPARFLGQSTRAAQSRGPGTGPLRRLQSEIEMWLHGADFHAGRSARMKVNGLWLWGRTIARPMSDSAAGSRAGQLYANDLAARAGAAAAGIAHAKLPEHWTEARPAGTHGGGDLYAVINITGTDITTQLADFEQRWFMPALAAHNAGRFATLELVCTTRRWQVDRAARWRFWRRPRHWLPELLAC